MATTRIWSIKGRLDSVINYIENSDKTDGAKYSNQELAALQDVIDYAENPSKTNQRLYVTGINCSPDIARDQMMLVKKKQYCKTDKILAYHGYQSFAPGEVTPDIAHEIGIALAKRLWGDKYQILVTTHLDKEHLHNHFCLNSVSFTDGSKFRGGIKAYNIMRDASDKLCMEYGLSIIENPQKGKSYAEWKAEHEGKPTIRGQIRDEIDEIIKCSYTYKNFIDTMQKRGYELKIGVNIKYPAVKPAQSKKFIRLKSLGDDYTTEAIQNRIIMARNGIKELDKPINDYNDWSKKYEPKKLTGFKALYFHYLYLFGKIRKKETPQRVSFYMREELLKLGRYQKQFHFLYDNNIETLAEVKTMLTSSEQAIQMLTYKRQGLYKHKSENGVPEQIANINSQLKSLRIKVRMCKNIVSDSEIIKEKYNKAEQFEQESEMIQNKKIKIIEK